MFTPPTRILKYKIRSTLPINRIEQMFAKELRRAGHVRKFSIRDAGTDGWAVRDEQDDRVLKDVRYTDWHRVERALSMFNLQIDELESSGWIPEPLEATATR